MAPKWLRSNSFWPFGAGRGTKELQKGPWDQVKGCRKAPRRHQGGTREAPGRHQGGTREAPRRHLGIVMGPRALKKRTKNI